MKFLWKILPTLVVTANYKQFCYYKRKEGWDKNYIYAGGSPNSLRGKEFGEVIYRGEWRLAGCDVIDFSRAAGGIPPGAWGNYTKVELFITPGGIHI